MCNEVLREYGGRYHEAVLFKILGSMFPLVTLPILLQAIGVVDIIGSPQHHPTASDLWFGFATFFPLSIVGFYTLRRIGRRRGALLQVYRDRIIYTEWRGTPKVLPITRQTRVETYRIVNPSAVGEKPMSIPLAMLRYGSEEVELKALVDDLVRQCA